jgi:hypothetical protein
MRVRKVGDMVHPREAGVNSGPPRGWEQLRADAAALTAAELDCMTGGTPPDPPPRPALHQAWARLAAAHPDLRHLQRCPYAEPTPPDETLTDAELRRLLGSLFDRRHRPLLLAVLAQLLAPAVAEVVAALTAERRVA